MSGIRRDGPDNALVRIHVTGASGAGTTTLGRALAAELGCPHFDSDDYFWLPTDPPCATKREAKERNRMLLTDLRGIAACVESGSLLSWSEEITALFDAVVFLWIPQAIRLARLRARELAEIGRVDEDFMEWAKSYDVEGNRETRSLLLHEEWLTGLSCPVLRLEGDLSNAERLARAMEWLKSVQREAK
jgi:adenylate kinase family enzyme